MLLGKGNVIQSNSFIAASEQVRLEPALEHRQRRISGDQSEEGING